VAILASHIVNCLPGLAAIKVQYITHSLTLTGKKKNRRGEWIARVLKPTGYQVSPLSLRPGV